ncbi:peptidase inhibitor family I36 protein [Nonomuraea sp. NPDC046802]|uniref:peptidase inhibitor family I36 protein n=1 Tax=Nonomuraea sp. NPDC046802 TaxID=3154919 RepID=UPI0034057811
MTLNLRRRAAVLATALLAFTAASTTMLTTAATAQTDFPPPQSNVPTLQVGKPAKTVYYPPDGQVHPAMTIEIQAPDYTRITRVNLNCTGRLTCPVSISDDGTSATGRFPAPWRFDTSLEVDLQATEDAPTQGGTFTGTLTADGNTTPLTVNIQWRGNPPIDDEARRQCRQALDGLEVIYGLCLWSEQDFGGRMWVEPNPTGPNVCHELGERRARSAVNFTRTDRNLYAYTGCQAYNSIATIGVNQVLDHFNRDLSAGSWT